MTLAADTGNFGSPSNVSNAIGYNVYLTDQAGTLYGFLQGNGPPPGSIAGLFANVYFGLNHSPSGSTFGFELGNHDAFTPGAPGSVAAPDVVIVGVGSNIEFSIPNSYFEGALTGLSNTIYAVAGDTITFRLSQSFGYSVAGGSSYGTARLGEVTLNDVAATPLPATLPLFAGGLSALGLLGWRKKRKAVA